MKKIVEKTGYLAQLIFVLLFASAGCQAQKSFTYDLEHPLTIIELPHKVNEISGMAYTNGSVYAIDDNHGNVYKIELKQHPKVDDWSYGKGKDYEDIDMTNGKIYVLNSNGHIVYFDEVFPIDHAEKSEPDVKGKNEFESLYFDPAQNKMVALCKDCSFDDKDENTAWAFDLASHSFDKEPLYSIKRKDIEKVYGKKIGRFKPSAARINPLTHELYIISSINRILVVMKNNQVQQVVGLKSDLLKQPEGICFSPSGDLLISNESAGKGPATILVYQRK